MGIHGPVPIGATVKGGYVAQRICSECLHENNRYTQWDIMRVIMMNDPQPMMMSRSALRDRR